MLRGNCSSVVLVDVWREKHPAHRLWKWSHLWEDGVSLASFYFLLTFGSDTLALKSEGVSTGLGPLSVTSQHIVGGRGLLDTGSHFTQVTVVNKKNKNLHL